MTKPRLLDLFSGAGGAARGYQFAGFHVTGVDINPQPNYCGDEFHQADALTYPLDGFDVIHASPPCQGYMTGGLVNRHKHPNLLGPIRKRLQTTATPWVIENVPGAPMRPDVMLCGSMFNLQVRRHRWFEIHPTPMIMISPCDHTRPVTGVYGNPHGQQGAWPGMLPSDLPTWRQAMGIDWMTASEIGEAIPPAYCQFIGEQLLAVLHDADGHYADSSPEHTRDTSASPGHRTNSVLSTDGLEGNASSEHLLLSTFVATDANSPQSVQHQDAVDSHRAG